MARPKSETTWKSQEEKELILDFFKTRGINRGCDALRIAVFDYIRRRLPKTSTARPHQRLRAILNGVDGENQGDF